MFCTNCGKQNEEGQAFCIHCGSPVPQAEQPAAYCTNCGEQLKDGTNFCIHCGAARDTATASSIPDPNKKKQSKLLPWIPLVITVAAIVWSLTAKMPAYANSISFFLRESIPCYLTALVAPGLCAWAGISKKNKAKCCTAAFRCAIVCMAIQAMASFAILLDLHFLPYAVTSLVSGITWLKRVVSVGFRLSDKYGMIELLFLVKNAAAVIVTYWLSKQNHT